MRVDTGDTLVDAQPLDVASLLKQFLRELPEPLLTLSLHDVFISCVQNGKAVDEAVLLSCLLLPPYNLATLRYVALFLARVAAASDANRMNAANLAVCLAPNLLYTDLLPASSSSSSHVPNVAVESSLLAAETAVIRAVVERAAEVGMISESLVQRATLLGTCYSSDVDEHNLNASVSTAGVGRKKSMKRKKKKRSGSLQGRHFYAL